MTREQVGRLLGLVLLLLLVFGLPYLALSYTYLDFNPGDWGERARWGHVAAAAGLTTFWLVWKRMR